MNGPAAPLTRNDSAAVPVVVSNATRWALAIVATLTMAVSYADRQAFAVLAPRVTEALHISDATYGWLLSAFSFAYLIGAPLGGRWVDGIGARRGLTWAVLVWSLIAGLHALVPGVAVLFLLRICLALAEAPSFPGAAQTVHRALLPEDRPRGFGILFIGSSLGAMVVPPLVTSLEHRYGFRFAFLGTAIVGLSWLPLWLWVTRGQSARTLLEPGGTEPSRSSSFADAMIWVRHPAVLRGILVVLAASPVCSFALLWSSKFLVSTHHLSLLEVGKLLWLPPVLMDVGSVGFGAIASAQLRRRGPASPPPRGLLVLAAMVAAVIGLLGSAAGSWQATICIGIASAGGVGLFALSTADALARIPPAAVSTCAGLLASGQSLAYIIASPLIGRCVQLYGYGPVEVLLALWLIPGCVAWLLWEPPPRIEALAQAAETRRPADLEKSENGPDGHLRATERLT